jgi:hypothetical protein
VLMYWSLNAEGKIWFHRYEYDAERHIQYATQPNRVKICKWGPVEPFGLHPNLTYWLSDVTSDCGTDRECMCHEDFNSVYKYVKKRLDMDYQREILRIKINSGDFDEFITVCE